MLDVLGRSFRINLGYGSLQALVLNVHYHSMNIDIAIGGVHLTSSPPCWLNLSASIVSSNMTRISLFIAHHQKVG